MNIQMNHIFTPASFLFFVKMNNITEEKNTRDFSPTFFLFVITKNSYKSEYQQLLWVFIIKLYSHTNHDFRPRLDFMKPKKIWQ